MPSRRRIRFLGLVAGSLSQLFSPSTFAQLPEGSIRALLIHPAVPSSIQVVQDDQWWQSSDGGESWSPAARVTVPNLADLTPDPEDPEILYATDRGGIVFRSEDGGRSWQAASFGLEAQALRLIVDPADPATLFAETPRGVFRSQSQGDGWHRDLDRSFGVFAIDPRDPARRFVLQCTQIPTGCTSAFSLFSDDFGESWKQVGSVDFLGGTNPETRDTLTRILEAHAMRPISGLWADPRTPGRLYAASPIGLWIGKCSGTQWRRSGPVVAIEDLALRAAGGPTEIYAATTQGLLVSLDGGDSWSFDRTLGQGPIHAVAVDATTGRIWVAAGTRLWSRMDSTLPWRVAPAVSTVRSAVGNVSSHRTKTTPTRHRGAPLARAEADPIRGLHLDHHVAALAVDPQHSHVVFAGGSRGVFRSRNGGDSWTPVLAGAAASDVHALAIDPSEPRRIWAGSHGDGLFISRNGGDSWHEVSPFPGRAIQRLVVDPERTERIFAVSVDRGLSASFDGGESWRTLRDRPTVWAGDLQDLSLDPDDPRLLSVVTWAGVFRGRVLGVEPTGPVMDSPWSYERAEPVESRIRAVVETPGAPGTLYLGTHDGLLLSRDESRKRWLRLGPPVAISDLALAPSDPRRLAAATSQGVLLHDDERPEGELAVMGPVFSVAFDPADARTLFAGTDRGEVLRSFDGGDTWQATVLLPPAEIPPARGAVLSPDWGARSRPASHHRLSNRNLPPEASRLRALLATELAGREAAERKDELRLRRSLRRLQQELADFLRRGGLSDLRFGPRDRWLAASFRYDDGRRQRSEIRLYRPDDLFFPTDAESPTAPSERWKIEHNPLREPIHQMPARVLSDAGSILAWHPEGDLLVTRAEESRALLWLLDETAKDEHTPERLALAVDHHLDHAAFHGDGDWLALAGRHGGGRAKISLWRFADTGLRKTELEVGSNLAFLRFSPNGHWLLGFGNRGALFAWPMTGETPGPELTVPIFDASDRFITALAAEQGHRWVLASRTRSGERRLVTFNLDPDGPGAPNLLTTGAYGSLALDSRGRWLAVQGRSAEDSVLLLDLESPDPAATARHLDRGAQVAGFTRGGDFLVLRDRDHLRVYEVAAIRARASSFPVAPGARWTGERTGLLESTEAGLRWWRWTGPEVRVDDLRAPETPGPFEVAVDGKGSRFLVAGRSGLTRHQLGSLPSESAVLRLGRFDILGDGPDPLDTRAAAGPLASLEPHPEEESLRELLDRACRIAGRPLTPAEWKRAFPDAPYDPLCVPPRKSKRATIGS